MLEVTECYISQLLEEFKVKVRYIFQLLKVTVRYIYFLETLKITAITLNVICPLHYVLHPDNDTSSPTHLIPQMVGTSSTCDVHTETEFGCLLLGIAGVVGSNPAQNGNFFHKLAFA